MDGLDRILLFWTQYVSIFAIAKTHLALASMFNNKENLEAGYDCMHIAASYIIDLEILNKERRKII